MMLKMIKGWLKVSWLLVPLKMMLKKFLIKRVGKIFKEIEDEVMGKVLFEGMSKANKAIDKWQEKLQDVVRDSWIPNKLEVIIIKAIQEKGDVLQKSAKVLVDKHGPEGLRMALVTAEMAIVKLIKRL